MKNLIKSVLVLAIFGLFSVASVFAGNAKFNDSSAPGSADLPTIMVRNKTQEGSCTTSCSWHNSVSADPGDIVTFQIYYHNTSETNSAIDTKVRLNQPTTASKNFTISGDVYAVNASSAPGSANVSITGSQPQSLLFQPGTVYWYAEKPLVQKGLLGSETSLFNGTGLSIGTVLPWGTCTNPGPYYHDSFCHRGFVTVQFKVTGTVPYNPPNPPQPPVVSTCSIDDFHASSQNINYNSGTTLHWSTTNCNSISITPAGSVNYYSAGYLNGSVSTKNLYSTKTFILTAYGSNNSDTDQVTVNVNPQIPNQTICSIDDFYATDNSIDYNDTTTLHWSTTNCNSISITPSSYINSYSSNYVNGSVGTKNLKGDRAFTITAYGSNSSDTKIATVYVADEQDEDEDECTIDDFYANDENIDEGDDTILKWETTNCDSISISPDSYVDNYDDNDEDGEVRTDDLYSDRTFTLYAYGDNGSDTATVRIDVDQEDNNPAPQPFDYCDNLFGIQTITPNGYYRSGTSCLLSYVPPTPQPIKYVYLNNNPAPVQTNSLVTLTIDSRFENVNITDIVSFDVTYKNTSNKETFNNTIVQVLIPENLDFQRSSAGEYSVKDRTLTVIVGNLDENETGSFYFETKVSNSAKDNELLVTNATLSFKNRANAGDTVVAYETNRVSRNNGSLLGATAFFAGGPISLIGLLLVILLILIIIHYSRKMFTKNATNAHMAPHVASHTSHTPEPVRLTTPPHDLPH